MHADPTSYSESVQPLTTTIFFDPSIPELVLLDAGEPVLLDAEDLVLLDAGEAVLLDLKRYNLKHCQTLYLCRRWKIILYIMESQLATNPKLATKVV